MVRTALTICALVAIAVIALDGVATDLSGDWTLTMDPDFKGNRAVSNCRFKHEGNKLVVRCGGGTEMVGTVKGRESSGGFLRPPGRNTRLRDGPGPSIRQALVSKERGTSPSQAATWTGSSARRNGQRKLTSPEIDY